MLTYILPKVVCKLGDKKDISCVAINVPLLLSHNTDVFGNITSEQFRDDIKDDDMVMGIFQNHFLQPGWFPTNGDSTMPVKIKRTGADKNSKSLSCFYLKRSCFDTDQLQLLDSGKP